MDTFLRQIAQRIVTDHPKDTDKVLVVFNNNRSKRFFTKQFDSLGKATFLPKVMAIDELISQMSGLEIVQNEFLLFELYKIHEELGGTERKYQSFEEFISFGDLMMGDFSEIDQYMVDARAIFDNLHALKSIGEWNIEGTGLTDFQRKYLDFYRSLYQYYDRLHQRLLAKGQAYSGMAYREVAERMRSGEWRAESKRDVGDIPGKGGEGAKWEAVYFVGFNALSKCEETIIGEYVHCGIGHLLTDNDIYFQEPYQEAGYFLEKHVEEFPELRPVGPSHFETCRKEITIVDCPENILQCKFAGQLLSEHPEWLNPNEAESTAVVLADEKLLIPTLNALPETGTNYSVNITMGYAYADSLIHAMATKLFSLYRQHNTKGYYHSDLTEVLSDRFIGLLLEASNLRRSTEIFLRSGNHIRCNGETIKELLSQADAKNRDLADTLFPDETPTPDDCLTILRLVASALANSDLLEKNRKEKQALGSLVEVLDNLTELQLTYPDTVKNIDTLEKIYSRLAMRHSISLIGEPLSGLQILGMLETRNLDFKRVILLSANEGILPAGRGGNTLIPLHLKSVFGLPTYVEKDSVYAHHFYRLLQRAKEVYLVFSSENDGMGKGEASRFIRQVECELAPKFGIPLHKIAVKTDTSLAACHQPEPVKKSDSVMRRLAEMGQRGLSPTSFCDYMDCPLKYYYSRVLQVKEVENIDEDLDAAQLGDCIHEVLEKTYAPHLGRPLQASVLTEALERLPEMMADAFQKLYSGGRNTEGRNRFLYSVAESQLRHILEQEKARLEKGEALTIEGVEKVIEGYVITPGVNLKGKIDRVDRHEGCLRIIDYKTGRLEKTEITYNDGNESMPGKWLQLMWYALLYCRTAKPSGLVKSGIYPLRNLRSDVKMACWKSADWDDPEAITPEKLDRFESLLRERIDELMNPAVDFFPTPSKGSCLFCPVKNFCDYFVQ